jgi:hypothetical protein
VLVRSQTTINCVDGQDLSNAKGVAAVRKHCRIGITANLF